PRTEACWQERRQGTRDKGQGIRDKRKADPGLLSSSPDLQCRHTPMADTLGSFEQAVLLAILRLGENAYGRAVLNEVQVRLERDVAAGAVHATLERLERKGLVA